MSSTILWLLFVSLTVVMSEDHRYCAVRYRRLCQGKGRHVACQFPYSGPGSTCERYTQIKFTEDLKYFITHYINRRRQRIATGNERVRGGLYLPKPQIMMLVDWDRELAQLAQRLADQCQFVHDECRATVKYPYAGQSVGEVRWRKSSKSADLNVQRGIRRVLDAWWGERRRVQPKQLTSPFRLSAKGTVWGHFSQLAVWNLQAVGCGAVHHGARHPRLLVVCDFSHTNMLGQRTLVPGEMAPCPIHTARRSKSSYSELCAPVHRSKTMECEEMDNCDDEEDDNADYVETATEARFKSNITRIPKEEPAQELLEMNRDLDDEERETAMFKNEQRSSSQPSEYVKLERPLKKWHEMEETVTDQPPVQSKVTKTYHSTIKEDITEKSYTVQKFRRRWKKTRFRPQRPGANVLLQRATSKTHTKKPVIGSLNLDKDDIDQLFRDTGFNLHWRKNIT